MISPAVFKNCDEILKSNPKACSTGRYAVDPDGPELLDVFEASCTFINGIGITQVLYIAIDYLYCNILIKYKCNIISLCSFYVIFLRM